LYEIFIVLFFEHAKIRKSGKQCHSNDNVVVLTIG